MRLMTRIDRRACPTTQPGTETHPGTHAGAQTRSSRSSGVKKGSQHSGSSKLYVIACMVEQNQDLLQETLGARITHDAQRMSIHYRWILRLEVGPHVAAIEHHFDRRVGEPRSHSTFLPRNNTRNHIGWPAGSSGHNNKKPGCAGQRQEINDHKHWRGKGGESLGEETRRMEVTKEKR